ncbi:MAG: hypothetical protein AAGH42_09335 [Pseudomonadota bacterium]
MPSITLSPLLLDAILAGLIVELIIAAIYLRRRGAASAVWPLALFLVSGWFLFLALRLLVAGVSHGPVALCLGVAFISHLLLIRWGLSRLNEGA